MLEILGLVNFEVYSEFRFYWELHNAAQSYSESPKALMTRAEDYRSDLMTAYDLPKLKNFTTHF
jgi:hypothetical protein